MLKIQTKTNKGINKEFSINMTNKTPLCILYEYANQVHKVSPRFEIEEKENPKDPFLAVCYINNDVCGRGTGNSKKTAKNNAGIYLFPSILYESRKITIFFLTSWSCIVRSHTGFQESIEQSTKEQWSNLFGNYKLFL